MTQDQLRDELWESLPWLRARLLGRARVDRMIDACMSQAPLGLLAHVADRSDQIDIVAAAWRASAKKSYCSKYGDDAIEFGPLFWIIASAVLQHLITMILTWWFENRSCRDLIVRWQP